MRCVVSILMTSWNGEVYVVIAQNPFEMYLNDKRFLVSVLTFCGVLFLSDVQGTLKTGFFLFQFDHKYLTLEDISISFWCLLSNL